MWLDPSRIDPSLDARAVTFENPTGERGAGGTAHGGRKGAPSRTVAPGETVQLADITGPGVIRHIWMTFPPAPPDVMRALWMEVFYDDATDPSISVPCLDFFGLPNGRPVPYASMLASAQEGRGFNAYYPMPFRDRVRVEVTNSASRNLELFFQIDYTLEDVEPSYLHVTFRRENPTTMKEDFTIVDGLEGPGRFLGCAVGIRIVDPEGIWYGEGEVKIFKDGDTDLPTICGTGLEDYVGSAWGLGSHDAPFAGSPLDVRREHSPQPDFVGFYRWHVPDPVMFERYLRVTIQQIGAAVFGDDATLEKFAETHPVAGDGWLKRSNGLTLGIHERVDDYCAAAFVYCTRPQPVPRLDVSVAVADIERLDYEKPHPMERFLIG
ncbi:MAG: glycoside hydrolase family 172 protein [Actinomycetota bacterium]